MRAGVVLTAVGVVALAATVVGYAVRYGGFGTAAGVVALASVGAVRLSCANRRGADSAVIDRQPAALTRAR